MRTRMSRQGASGGFLVCEESKSARSRSPLSTFLEAELHGKCAPIRPVCCEEIGDGLLRLGNVRKRLGAGEPKVWIVVRSMPRLLELDERDGAIDQACRKTQGSSAHATALCGAMLERPVHM